jgi:hypothetical protein
VAIEEDLVWYLVQAVQDEQGIPAKTKLVKLIYLVDLHHMKRFGRPATSIRWIFYLYGPYAAELERAIDRQVGLNIRRREVLSHFDEQIYTYKSAAEPPDDLLPRGVQAIADQVSREWAVRDLNELLNFVYFDTPPMMAARRGEPLDLTQVLGTDWPRRYVALSPPTLPPDLQKGLETWRKRVEEDRPVTPLDPPARYDEEYARETDTFQGPEPGDRALARGQLTIDPNIDLETQ